MHGVERLPPRPDSSGTFFTAGNARTTPPGTMRLPLLLILVAMLCSLTDATSAQMVVGG